MTDRPRRPHSTVRRLAAEQRGGAGAPRVLPLGGVESLAVSAEAIRAKLGAWVGLSAPDERPDLDAAWREVLLVLGALVEAGSAGLGREALPPWEREVPVPREPLDLQRRTALSRDSVRRGVDRAISAEVLDLMRRVGDELVVRLRPDVFGDAPVVAAVDWDAVRGRLGVAVSPVALLLVREIARRTAPERRTRGEAVPVSLRELGGATGASKGTIQKTLGALHAAGLVESWTRDRVDSWHRLLPAAFGEAGAPTRATATAETSQHALPPVVPLTPDARGGVPEVSTDLLPPWPPRRVTAAPPPGPATPESAAPPAPATPLGVGALARAGLAVTVYEVNGVPWPLPAGVRPQLERSADGSSIRRIGNVRLPTQRVGDPGAPLWFEVDGIAWDILPDARPELERDSDGRYWYRIDGERWPFRLA